MQLGAMKQGGLPASLEGCKLILHLLVNPVVQGSRLAGCDAIAESLCTQLGVMKRGGLPASMEDCERMVGLLDGAHQGGVSFQDFTRFVALLPEAQVQAQAQFCVRSGDHSIIEGLCTPQPCAIHLVHAQFDVIITSDLGICKRVSSRAHSCCLIFSAVCSAALRSSACCRSSTTMSFPVGLTLQTGSLAWSTGAPSGCFRSTARDLHSMQCPLSFCWKAYPAACLIIRQLSRLAWCQLQD